MTSKVSLLRRIPLKQEIFDVLHQDILSGHYPRGAWLRQEEISKRLGVSMTPVREALDLLVSSGLAERVAYRGVRILQMDGPDILDAYEMRLLLEASAARAAAKNVSPSQLDQLEALLEEGEGLFKLESLPRAREVSRRLHLTIVDAGGNDLRLRIYREALRAFPDWMLYEHLYRKPALLQDSLRDEQKEHRLIVEALGARDPDSAMQRAMEHVVARGHELELYLGISRADLAAREAQVRYLLPELEAQTSHP